MSAATLTEVNGVVLVGDDIRAAVAVEVVLIETAESSAYRETMAWRQSRKGSNVRRPMVEIKVLPIVLRVILHSRRCRVVCAQNNPTIQRITPVLRALTKGLVRIRLGAPETVKRAWTMWRLEPGRGYLVLMIPPTQANPILRSVAYVPHTH